MKRKEIMEDYSLYLIKAQKLLNRILEEANRKDFDTAFDYAFSLEQLAGMLKESLKETV
jgi:hypothetical protein